MEKHNKKHFHRLESFSDNRRHHYFCHFIYCGREFWSDEIVESMIQDAYLDGHDEGFREGRNPKILVQWAMDKLQQYLRSRKMVKYSHEEHRKN